MADVNKSTEKEVMFVDAACGVTPKDLPHQTSQSKAPGTYPKSIMKNSSAANTPTPESALNPPPKWEIRTAPSDASKPEGSKRPIVETIDSITQESDLESEADFFRKLTPKEVSLESDCAEESILSHDEDDDDFKVHFVHHGKKKAEDNMNMQSDLMFQINELQEAVICMKGSLNEAVTKLSLVDGTSPTAEMEEIRRKCDGSSAEILKMVLELRTDFSCLRQEMSTVSKRQESIQKSLCFLFEDRKFLANDLSQAGVISQQTRSRLDSFTGIISTGGHSGSGSHSNDSGVAMRLENSQTAFGDDSGPLQLSGQRISDQDSLPDQPSLLVPASVYDYVAGLSQQNSSLSSTNTSNQLFCQDGLPTPGNEQVMPLHVKDGEEDRSESFDYGTVYDSDSSLTIAANKTISLSTCISQEIRVNDTYDSVSPSNQLSVSPDEDCSKRQSRVECEVSVSAKDRGCSQSRRRRPLLGVSSTKMYLSTSHCHPSGEKEHRLRHRYVSKGGDPREAQRYKLAKELVDTEKQYCRTLWTIQDVFAEPLRKADILSNKDIMTLFPEEVYLLYDKHCLLQHQLKERLASWKWQPLIGDILARFTDPQKGEVLRLYTSYVNDFPQVLKTFHKLCHTSQPFTDFIKRCLDQPACRGLDLGAFLLTPVQRVPKYILLLKQLLKYTNSTHPDYRLIDTVLERLRDFLSRLNSAMEQSFRIVNSTLSPSIGTPTTLTVVPTTPKYRGGRTSRKAAASSSRDNLTSNSPSNRRNRHARIYQPSSASPSGDYRSPKRSSSIALGTDSPHKSPTKHLSAERSASLPRGFTSMSSDSPDSSGDGQESSPERVRLRGENSRYRSPHEATPYHQRVKYLSLTPARSVTNVLAVDELKTTWEEMASSEPSLIEKSKIANTKILNKKSPPLSVATNASTAQKLVTWTDAIESTDDKNKNKKGSIKSSLKSMFNFKKRPNGHRHSREEPLYTSSSIILETSRECSPTHSHYAQTVQVPISSPSPVMTTTSGITVPVGDFLDEEGNPCSNV